MARRKPTKKEAMTFNVIYEDGTLSSNRRVAGSEFEDGTAEADVARRVIAAQDARIAEMSGVAPRQIKSITKVKS